MMRYYYEKGAQAIQDLTQYYVVELQQYDNGEYGHMVFPVFDTNPSMARRKGDSKLYEVLSAAAISNLPEHAAALIGADTTPLGNAFYTEVVTEDA